MKATVACSTRIKITTFADLAAFFKEQGLEELNQSRIISTAVELLHSQLVAQGHIRSPLTDPMSAKNLLDAMGILNVAPGRKGFQKFLEDVQERTLAHDFGSTDYLKRSFKQPGSNPSSRSTPRDLINRENLVNECELEEVIEAAREKARERDEEFRRQQTQFIPKKGKTNDD